MRFADALSGGIRHQVGDTNNFKPARRATLAGVLALGGLGTVVAGAGLYGNRRWNAGTRALRARLDKAGVAPAAQTVDFRELEGLPVPVQRYFTLVLEDGQPMVKGVSMRHSGFFNLGETADRWRRFTSDQKVVTRRPGFDWDGRVAMMPGLPVRVHDAYVAGEGILHASLVGLFPLVDVRGTGDVAAGELMRFFAEAAWYPTALLPSQGVRWEVADGRSARATLSEGDLTLTMRFTFGEHGLIDTVRAEERGRMVSGKLVPTPWRGRFWNYEARRHAGAVRRRGSVVTARRRETVLAGPHRGDNLRSREVAVDPRFLANGSEPPKLFLEWDEIICLEKRNQFDCDSCRYQFSVTAGTIFHDTHLPLWKWFLAVNLVIESKKGISANQLKRTLGVSYKAAWYLCHRIRAALNEVGAQLLKGIVEADEAFVGGKVEGQGRGYKGKKTVVVCALQRDGNICLQVVRGRDRETLYGFIRENVSGMLRPSIPTNRKPTRA